MNRQRWIIAAWMLVMVPALSSSASDDEGRKPLREQAIMCDYLSAIRAPGARLSRPEGEPYQVD